MRGGRKSVASAILADVEPGFQPGGTSMASQSVPEEFERVSMRDAIYGRQDAALYGRQGCLPLRAHRQASAGFTRRDLVFVILGVAVLILVLGMVNGQELRRTWSCKQRLKDLNGAFQQYANDNANALPPAALIEEERQTAWDQKIAHYLTAMPKNNSDTNVWNAAQEKAAGYFACPSDREPRGGAGTRSYSMPMYDVKKQGWPPDSESVGGVGLFLDQAQLKAARTAMLGEGNKFIPVLKADLVSAPADTALLVERIAIRNGLWGTTFACTVAPREQWDAKTLERNKFHGGKFNYLFLDGHVELLTERQSGGHVGNGGVWTIRAGD
jgi:prepilin-type processing-associated H-X9-DG protein